MRELFESDFDAYRDENGLIQNAPHPAIDQSENGILFTAHYFRLKALLGLLDVNRDMKAFADALKTCEVAPGLYNRHALMPKAYQGPDDYAGLISGSEATGCVFQYHFLSYGRAHQWCFNTMRPGVFEWRAWFGRFPALIAHAKIATGFDFPNLFLSLAWAWSVAFSGKGSPQSQDERILSWHLVETYKSIRGKFPRMRSKLFDWAVNKFEWRLKKDWGNIHEVFKKYFNDEQNPTVKWSSSL